MSNENELISAVSEWKHSIDNLVIINACGVDDLIGDSKNELGKIYDKILNLNNEKNQQDNILCEIKEERDKQDKKWGIQDHDEFKWLAILGEEVGEANKAVLENHFGSDNLDNYREELVQVAAVAVAMIECHDRKSHNLNPRIFGGKNGS